MNVDQLGEDTKVIFLVIVIVALSIIGVLVSKYIEAPERLEAIKAGLQQCKVDAAIVWQRDCPKEVK